MIWNWKEWKVIKNFQVVSKKAIWTKLRDELYAHTDGIMITWIIPEGFKLEGVNSSVDDNKFDDYYKSLRFGFKTTGKNENRQKEKEIQKQVAQWYTCRKEHTL